jgi:hypothetical protein
MVRDFGGRDAPRWRKGQRYAFLRQRTAQGVLLFALVLMGLLPIAMPASLEQTIILGHHATADQGPCRPITEAAFNRGWKDEPYVFTFSGVTFARRRGDADCTSQKHGLFGVVGAIWPTCSFDTPYQVAVTRGGRTDYFAVPPGYEAKIAAAPEGPRCVVTHRYDIYSLSG